ncbi:peptidase G1 [Boletus reticuloceps]|uniref:Peptidase G1 n=1 Tax=Boletus reticuloceps TaxID=495285 RepID=A0A8I2YSC7_9AGAM|nr:peptidase G1 [Boletus reticuloceps]
MRLNCALVSSFLFVSAVLAAEFGEFGGVMYGWNSPEKVVTYARGRFTVPYPEVGVNSGFVIGVGLDGHKTCMASLSAGIRVMITEHKVNIEAWSEFAPNVPNWNPQFTVSSGDILEVTVNVVGFNLTDGHFSIENISTGQKWSEDITSHELPLCKGNAYWGVAIVPGGQSPFANFNQVTFTNTLIKLGFSDPGQQPRDTLSLLKINQNDHDYTSVNIVLESYDILVTYIG